jgi:hypothetical protein
VLLAATNVTERAALLVAEQEQDTSGQEDADITRDINNRLGIQAAYYTIDRIKER